MMALCLAREDAVEGWREMLGPKEVSVAAEQAPDRYSDIIIYIYSNKDKSLQYTLLELYKNLFLSIFLL